MTVACRALPACWFLSTVIDRRYRGRRNDLVIERRGLETASFTGRTSRIGPIATEQNTNVHFVRLALEPFEKSTDAVPAIVLGQLLGIGVFVACFAIDHEILVGFGQIFEWNARVDLFAGAGAHQIALGLAHFLATKDADGSLRD